MDISYFKEICLKNTFMGLCSFFLSYIKNVKS